MTVRQAGRMAPRMEIVTERLLLRPARPDDVDALHAIFTRPEALTWWASPVHTELEQTAAWLQGMLNRAADGLDLIIEREGRVIGKAGFWKPPDIGYILHPDAWGQGLAREAIDAVIRRLFETTDFHEATADVDPANRPSIRLLEKLGFRKTGSAERTWNIGGEWKDSLYYALKREDWAAHHEA